LASLSHAQSTVAEPVVRPRPRPRTKPKTKTRTRKRTQSRARGGILWIAVSGILLAGVVFVNVAVLRLNLSLDSANSERTKLRAENATLQSNLSRELASSQIQTRAAKEFGLTYADPSQYGYVNLAKK
jgi:cell division protein FtsL